MRVFLLAALCALGCGSESGTLFSGDPPRKPAAVGGTAAVDAAGESGEGGEPSSVGGAPVSNGGAGPMAGRAGSGGASAAGSSGAAQAGGGGGATAGAGGAEGGNGAGQAGSAAANAGGSKPNEPEIPEACSKAGACMATGPVAGHGYCEISEVWPAGSCVQCPNHYLDCDGPAPEVYGMPGAGCETFDTNQGKCPAK